ncbi:MAG: C40 family peptidase [Candidatus Woesearchaeota archaeon]
MLRNNKKGISIGFWLALALIMVTMYLIVAINTEIIIDAPLGENQYKLLEANEKSEIAKIYLEQSFKYALQNSINTFQTNKNQIQLDYFCGEHVHPIYLTSNKKNCVPDFNLLFKSNVDNEFQKYFSNSKLFSFYSWDYYILTNQRTNFNKPTLSVNVVSLPNSKLKIPIGESTQNSEKAQYPIGPLGTCGNEIIKDCKDNQCIADVANTFYQLYSLSGLKFPYVWGGESPYTYEDTSLNGACSDFFDQSTITRFEPPPRNNILTKQGFDCSGWVWWVGKHANVQELINRKSADEYYQDFKNSKNFEWAKIDKDLTPELASEILIPGDIIFYKDIDDVKITHVMIYVGNLEIIHSTPNQGLIKETIPNTYYQGIQAISRYLIEKPTIDSAENTQLENEDAKECILYFDTSDWKNENIRAGQQNIDFNKFNEQLMTYENGLFTKSLEQAHINNPNVPTQLVKSIIYAETAGAEFDNYLSGKTKCSQVGYCGLMQMGSGACSDVKFICNWDSLKTGTDYQANNRVIDFRQLGVESGAAYLNQIIKHLEINGFTTPEKPNYYFTALLYNAGLGNGIDILEHAMDRTGTTKEFLKWSHITKADIRKEFPNDEAKVNEVYGYPNMVGKALSLQCSGDPLAMFVTGETYSRSYIEIQPNLKEEIEFDLKKYEKVNQFVSAIKSNCNEQTNLQECIQTSIKEVSNLNFKVYYLSDYSKFYGVNLFKDFFTAASTIFSDLFTSGSYYASSLGALNYEDKFKDSIVDQMLNCRELEQSNCLCPIYIDFSLLEKLDGTYDNQKIIKFYENSNNEYVADSLITINNQLFLNPESKSLKISFNPLLQTIGNDIDDKSSELNFTFTRTNLNENLTEMKFKNKLTNEIKSWKIKENSNAIYLYKKTNKDLQWYYYEDNPFNPPFCMNKQTYHRFAIDFNEEDMLKFSLAIEDKQMPQYNVEKSELNAVQHNCMNTNAVLLSWKIVEPTEPLYAFNIFAKSGTTSDLNTEIISQYESITKEDLENLNPIIINKLYYDESNKTFYYLTNKIGKIELYPNQQYTFSIAGVDNYNNSLDIDISMHLMNNVAFKIQENLNQNIIIQSYASSMGISKETLSASLCGGYVAGILGSWANVFGAGIDLGDLEGVENVDLSKLNELNDLLGSQFTCCITYPDTVVLSTPNYK